MKIVSPTVIYKAMKFCNRAYYMQPTTFVDNLIKLVNHRKKFASSLLTA